MNKPTKWRIVITILVLAILTFGGYNTGYNEGERAHADDYDAGYEKGYDDGYTEGYDAAEWDLGENDLSGYIGPAPDTSTYLTTDTAPAGTVWTTPAGEKYHEGWCRYVSGGRNDLTYYLSTTDAINAGYSPCSVCH